jgi:hypothetical protein
MFSHVKSESGEAFLFGAEDFGIRTLPHTFNDNNINNRTASD